jgi:hypothetical protein
MAQSEQFRTAPVLDGADHGRDRTRCTGCGGRATSPHPAAPFCAGCLEWARQSQLSEWDDLGFGD